MGIASTSAKVSSATTWPADVKTASQTSAMEQKRINCVAHRLSVFLEALSHAVTSSQLHLFPAAYALSSYSVLMQHSQRQKESQTPDSQELGIAK